VILLAVGVALGLGTGCSSENASSDEGQEARAGATAQEAGGGEQRRVADSRVKPFLIKGSKALDAGNHERALVMADSAAQYEPDLPLISFFRGNVYAEQNELDAARAAYRSAIEQDPGYPEAHMKLGNIEFDRGKFRTALRLYEKEEAVAPTSPLYVKMARTYGELGVADSARRAYEKAIARDSTNANAYMMYGQFLEDQGELKAALTQSRNALELDPDNTNYQFAVGSQLFRTGRLEEAARYLKRAADDRLLHSAAQYNMGQVLQRLGREEEAEYYLARADSARRLIDQISSAQNRASRAPDDVSSWVRLGELYREAGAFDRALRALQRAANLQPQNLAVQRQIAEVLLERGRTEEARQRFRALLEVDQTFAEAWVGLGRAYAAEGRCEEARRAWERGLDYRPDSSAAQQPLDTRCRTSG
jgi:tetratricopeptide (TPR) repeat protein